MVPRIQKLTTLFVILNVFFQVCNCTCTPYQGNTCTNFVSQEGVAADISSQQLGEVILESLGWSNITKIANVLAPDCSYHAQAFICNTFFPPCSESGGNFLFVCFSSFFLSFFLFEFQLSFLFSFFAFKKKFFSQNLEPIKICKQTCLNFQSLCFEFFNTSAAQDITTYLPDCETFQELNCTNLEFIPPLGLFFFSFFLSFYFIFFFFQK